MTLFAWGLILTLNFFAPPPTQAKDNSTNVTFAYGNEKRRRSQSNYKACGMKLWKNSEISKRAIVLTLEAHSSACNALILFQHISFFAYAPDLNISF